MGDNPNEGSIGWSKVDNPSERSIGGWKLSTTLP